MTTGQCALSTFGLRCHVFYSVLGSKLLSNETGLNANADFHPLGARRLRRLRNILLFGRNGSVRLMGTLVGDVSTESFFQCASIIREYLRIPLAA